MNTIVFVLESTVEFSLIASIALAAAAILRGRSAALRHWILSSAIACAAAAPILGLVVPSWQLPLGTPFASTAAAPRNVSAGVGTRAPEDDALRRVEAAPLQGGARSRPAEGMSAAGISTVAWAAGVAVNLAVLFAGVLRLNRVRSRSHAVRNPQWTEAAANISRAYGLRRDICLLQSDHPTLLVTWGIVRPKVVLPRGAQSWSIDRVRVVLCHELAHIQRGDWVTQIVAELLRSVYWFNPLAWLMCRRLRHESEHATDDTVLNAGVEGGDYAAHLLDLARAVRHQGETWWPAPAIVRSSTLERRIIAMLNTQVNRSPLTRRSRLLIVAILFGLAAAIASAQGALATLSGSVLDPMNRTLPNAMLVLTNIQTNAKHEVRSDNTGRFEFAELPSGDYSLEVKLPGFASLNGRVTMSGSSVQQNLRLQVGTLTETVTVTPDSTPSAPNPETDLEREEKRRRREREALTCGSTPHGGNIRPPMKVNHVAPDYPLHLGTAGVSGSVGMEALIAKDGTIKEARVVRSAHPDFEAAAVRAVRQWRFDSTLLNCMPIEVTMKVTVNFKAS